MDDFFDFLFVDIFMSLMELIGICVRWCFKKLFFMKTNFKFMINQMGVQEFYIWDRIIGLILFIPLLIFFVHLIIKD